MAEMPQFDGPDAFVQVQTGWRATLVAALRHAALAAALNAERGDPTKEARKP